MDETLSELERAWRADPGDSAARRDLLRALERAGERWETSGCRQAGGYRLERLLTGYGFETEFAVRAVLADDASLLLVATERELHLWRVPDMARDWGFGSPAIQDVVAVAISPAGTRVACLSDSGELGVYSRDTGELCHEPTGPLPHEAQPDRLPAGLAFTSEDELVSWGHWDGSLQRARLREGALARDSLYPESLKGRELGISLAAVGPTRERLVSTLAYAAGIYVWDLPEWTCRGPFVVHPDRPDPEEFNVESMGISPDGKRWVGAYADGAIVSASLETGERLAYHDFQDYAPDGFVWLESGIYGNQGCNNRYYLFDPDDLSIREQYAYPHGSSVALAGGWAWTSAGLTRLEDDSFFDADHEGPVQVAFLDEDRLVSVNPGSVPLRWDLATGEGQGGSGLRGPDGQHAGLMSLFAGLMSEGEELPAEVAEDQEEFDTTISPVDPDDSSRFAFSPDGRFAVEAQRGRLYLYEAADEAARTEEQTSYIDEVLVALRDDGLCARSQNFSNTVWLCDAREGELLAQDALEAAREEPTEVARRVVALAFSREGGLLVGFGDGRLVGWTVADRALTGRWERTFAPSDGGKVSGFGLTPGQVAASEADAAIATFAAGALRLHELDGVVRWEVSVEDASELWFEEGQLWVLGPRALRTYTLDGAEPTTVLEIDLSRAGDSLQSFAWSPRRERFAVGTRLGAVLLFERAEAPVGIQRPS